MDSVLVPSNSPKSLLVTHSNKITEARYSLTVAEQRFVLTLISMISPDDEDFKDYEIKISDFQKLLDINTNAVYKQTKEVLENLADKKIVIENGKAYLITHWFSSAEYIPEKGTVYISFDKKLKPYFLQLKREFTKYNLFTVANFKSAYTIRIYMLLKQYENIGSRGFALQELKEILGIEKNEYAEFRDFKKRVINQAKKEFEQKNKETHGFNSDISFDLETRRTGRKISHLKFIITKQTYQNTLPFDLPEPEGREDTKVTRELAKYGISYEIAHRYEQEQGEEAIFRSIAIFEQKKNQGEIQQGGAGYLLKLLENKAGAKTSAEKEAEAREKAKQEAKEKAERQKQEQEKREKLERAFSKKMRAEFLDSLGEGEEAELLETIKREHPESSILIKDLRGGIGGAFVLSKIPDYQRKKEKYIQENF